MKDVAFPKSAARHGVQEYETRVLLNLQAAPIPSDSRQALLQKRGAVLPVAGHGANFGVIANAPVDQLAL